MIPLSLRLRNFMSYGEDVAPLDFSQFTTACLTGDNGHGKSTLLDAITWALWGETRAKNIDDVVRLGHEDAEVEFIFDLEGARYRVLRKRSLKSRQSSLELQGFDAEKVLYKPLSGASIRETEAKIVQLLHMNYDTFINSVFVLQGRADEFTTRRPGERKRILADILGLSIYDALETRARAHRGEMDQDVKVLTQRLGELQEEVAHKETLAVAVHTQQEAVAHLQAELQQGQEHLEALRQQHTALELHSRRAHEGAQRLQQVQQERLEVEHQWQEQQRRLTDCDTILQQEATILAGYDTLQQLRAQERVLSTQADTYNTLQQQHTALHQHITMEQHRLTLEQRSASQRQAELQDSIQSAETFVRHAPQLTAAYHALLEARQQEAAMAQALQQRYALEQENNQVELRMQHKRHALELEQRSWLDQQREAQRKEAAVPTLQQQAAGLDQQLQALEVQHTRLEHIRAEGAAIRVQLDTTLPQAQETLQHEIDAYEDKRVLLNTAEAHCPLCATALSAQERQRVIETLGQEVAQRTARLQAVQHEQQQLLQQRQALLKEFKQAEQQTAQRPQLAQQYAATQARLAEATQAREHLVRVVQALQELNTRLTAGSYATEELARLRAIRAALDTLAYDRAAHEAVQHTLVTLAEADVQYARLQQAEAELRTLRSRADEQAHHLATLTQTLQSEQFALAQRLELQTVQERLAELDFSPVVYHTLQQQIHAQQHVERYYMQLETARVQVAETRTALQALEARRQRLATDLATLEQEQQHYASALGSLQSLRHEVAHTEAQVHALREREGLARVALGRSQSQYDHCLQQELELQRKLQQRDQAAKERTLYGDLAQMFGKNGIQAIMIENAIPELEDEANRLLGRVTRNAMHLTLETQRDTRSGGVAETLDIKISDALGTRNYEMFSGGEAFRINFALRVALAKMLARRAGTRLRTLVIDEGFGTQDTDGLERLVEVIKAIQEDFAKIIVITHLRELKNAFETHIEVKKDPVRGSFYQVV